MTRNSLGPWIALVLAFAPLACQERAEVTPAASPEDALVSRAASHEMDTIYVAPPGDALEHNTAGFAKTLCSAVFITGLDPDFAAENVGYFTGPYEERSKVTERRIDRENKSVHLTLPNGVVVTANDRDDQQHGYDEQQRAGHPPDPPA